MVGGRKASSNYIGGSYIKSYVEKRKIRLNPIRGGIRLSLISLVPWAHSRHGEKEREREGGIE